MLYVHTELEDTDFVEPLVCALRRVLTANVDTKKISIPLDAALLATPSQFDGRKVSERFATATFGEGGTLGGRIFKYLLMPQELKDDTYPVFGTSFPRHHQGVVSLAHLYTTNATASRDERAALTAQRTYKLILRSIARLAGLTNSKGCILASSRSLDELDAKSSEFCTGDHALLVYSGLLKEQESDGCALISQTLPSLRNPLTSETRRISFAGSAH